MALSSTAASAGDTQERLDTARDQLQQAEDRRGVQTDDLSALSDRIDELTAQLGTLRNREAEAEAELEAVQTRLDGAKKDLRIARERLQRMRGELKDQLVTFYKADQPSVTAFLLDAEGFDDLIGRSEYLSVIQDRTQAAAGQIAELRDQRTQTVETISAARDEIASREAEIEKTREGIESQEADLETARARQKTLLAATNKRIDGLSDDVGDLEKKLQKELAAQQAALGVTPTVAAPGATAPASNGQMVWPVDGTLTSPFGWRWGRMHQGLDIAVPEGTPVRAAASGTVLLAQSEAESGGYGNFTCLDHGGGLSTCYAHQLSIGVSVGQSVKQGQVIGQSGNTGNSTGPHVHFETRVNGSAVDPMGYL